MRFLSVALFSSLVTFSSLATSEVKEETVQKINESNLFETEFSETKNPVLNRRHSPHVCRKWKKWCEEDNIVSYCRKYDRDC